MVQREIYRSPDYIEGLSEHVGEDEYVTLRCNGCGRFFLIVQRVSAVQAYGGIRIIENTPECCGREFTQVGR